MPCLAAFALSACEYQEVKREIGYKGKARINPWLASERYAGLLDGADVYSVASWSPPESGDAVWFIPASILSNRSFTRHVDHWVLDGGHLVLLVEHANAETNDWSHEVPEPDLEPAVVEMAERAGFQLDDHTTSVSSVVATEIEFRGDVYQVSASSHSRVTLDDGKPGVFASASRGQGRMTVLTDSRIFRNRWVGEQEHAALLGALIGASDFEGGIGFMRGSGLSLWGLLGEHLWPLLLGLGVLALLWLWKNFSRFGPLEPALGTSVLRGYEHHLEALGSFQWRLDRASGLLAPLRMQVMDRGQRVSGRTGRRDDDFHQFLADRSGLPREQVVQALEESVPADSASLTRITADLQRLLHVLH